ncbi:MAG TPA: DinB family protein [Candidatus Limnocylindrales bacterium]|nr:DinB family protein [Candidatus Limnocylindrales bacterium]
MSVDLAAAVDLFDRSLRQISDSDLERPWAWGQYDEEGIRFAFFRTLEELTDLAVEVAARREEAGRPIGRAARLVGRYHVAWRELWSIVDGAGESLLDAVPAAGEWPLRTVLEHLVGADLGFLVAQRNAAERRAAGLAPARAGDAWERLAGTPETEFERIFMGPLDAILAEHTRVHDGVLELARLTDDELASESAFWDGTMPNRFRLGRFESHLRQHTIQVEKTIEAIAGPPREVDRLLLLIRRAQGEAESAAIGAEDVLQQSGAAVAPGIAARSDELVALTGVSA